MQKWYLKFLKKIPIYEIFFFLFYIGFFFQNEKKGKIKVTKAKNYYHKLKVIQLIQFFFVVFKFYFAIDE
jgi:hypothetical protein